MNSLGKLLPLALALLLLAPAGAGALNLESLKNLGGSVLKQDQESTATGQALPESDVVAGLKQALGIAVDRGIDHLGRPGGYLDTPEVTIPLPDELTMAGKALRAIGQDELVDEFVATMNSAAEEAVPETVEIFTDAIKEMTFDDAQQILDGPDDAATRYFERTSGDELTERIRPIVAAAMQQTGVTSAYAGLTRKVASAAPLVGAEAQDLEGYVTQKALDGLFHMLAQEEARIRNEPLEWTSDILKRVFGSVF